MCEVCRSRFYYFFVSFAIFSISDFDIVLFPISLQIVLETELTNRASIALYEKLGFCRSKLLKRYYMNGNDAYRLKLWLTVPQPRPALE